MRRFVRSVIQNATVTSAENSVALKLDPVLMRAMEVRAFEEVEIVNVVTGARLSTWVEEGAAGEVRVPQMRAGDVITIISHGFLHDGQTLAHKVRVVTAGPKNEVVSIGEQS
jgi:aspartate 1-decarboxylase